MSINSDQYQNRLINYLHSIKKKGLASLCLDNCSELSRLLGCWLLSEEECSISIYKGTEVRKLGIHDVLILKEQTGIQIWDPTIWQFDPDAKTILVTSCSAVSEIPQLLTEFYGGTWSHSESLTLSSCQGSSEEWEKIIRQNINS